MLQTFSQSLLMTCVEIKGCNVRCFWVKRQEKVHRFFVRFRRPLEIINEPYFFVDEISKISHIPKVSSCPLTTTINSKVIKESHNNNKKLKKKIVV